MVKVAIVSSDYQWIFGYFIHWAQKERCDLTIYTVDDDIYVPMYVQNGFTNFKPMNTFASESHRYDAVLYSGSKPQWLNMYDNKHKSIKLIGHPRDLESSSNKYAPSGKYVPPGKHLPNVLLADKQLYIFPFEDRIEGIPWIYPVFPSKAYDFGSFNITGVDPEAQCWLKITGQPTKVVYQSTKFTPILRNMIKLPDKNIGLHKNVEVIKIPKHIHFMWLSKDLSRPEVPNKYSSCINSWKQHNPDYTFTIWDNQSTSQLVSQYFPQYYQAWLKLDKLISRCDVARFMVISVHGGVYCDLDFYCKRNIDSFLTKDIFIMKEIPEHNLKHIQVFNGLFGACKDHNFVSGWIDTMMKSLHGRTIKSNDDVMTTTGPIGLGGYCFGKNIDFTCSYNFMPFTCKGVLSNTYCGEPIYAYTLWVEGSGWNNSTISLWYIWLLLIILLAICIVFLLAK